MDSDLMIHSVRNASPGVIHDSIAAIYHNPRSLFHKSKLAVSLTLPGCVFVVRAFPIAKRCLGQYVILHDLIICGRYCWTWPKTHRASKVVIPAISAGTTIGLRKISCRNETMGCILTHIHLRSLKLYGASSIRQGPAMMVSFYPHLDLSVGLLLILWDGSLVPAEDDQLLARDECLSLFVSKVEGLWLATLDPEGFLLVTVESEGPSPASKFEDGGGRPAGFAGLSGRGFV